MASLTDQQKQLLFDYCTGLASQRQAVEAEALISSNEEAAEICSRLKASLAPLLEGIESESCPDELAEGTVWRLNNLARSNRLEQLLAAEQARDVTARPRLWRSLGEMVAIAAVIVFVAGVLIAPLKFVRQRSRQQRCQMQLQRIWQGVNQYCADHNGRLPTVATAMGCPWWKVGYQGKENHSNTRHIWLLAKGDYVDPADFICPGRRLGKAIQFDRSQAKNYNDFPARGYVTYSFRIRPNKSRRGYVPGRKVLMSDLNPLFERLPQNYSNQLNLRLDKDLLNLNSTNHRGRGQNILFGNGRVDFVKIRRVGVAADDIFTLKDTEIYRGCEVPASETDAFLAP